MTQNTHAIIVKNVAYRDNDCLLTLLTRREGIIYARVTSARLPHSKLRGHCEPGREVSVMLTGFFGYRRIAQISTEQNFASTYVEKFYAQCCLFELIMKLVVGHEPVPHLYECVKIELRLIAQALDPDLFKTLYRALTSILTCVGLAPLIDACVVCKQAVSRQWYFFASRGGLVCQNCMIGEEDSSSRVPVYVNAHDFIPQLRMMLEHIEWQAQQKFISLRQLLALGIRN